MGNVKVAAEYIVLIALCLLLGFYGAYMESTASGIIMAVSAAVMGLLLVLGDA